MGQSKVGKGKVVSSKKWVVRKFAKHLQEKCGKSIRLIEMSEGRWRTQIALVLMLFLEMTSPQLNPTEHAFRSLQAEGAGGVLAYLVRDTTDLPGGFYLRQFSVKSDHNYTLSLHINQCVSKTYTIDSRKPEFTVVITRNQTCCMLRVEKTITTMEMDNPYLDSFTFETDLNLSMWTMDISISGLKGSTAIDLLYVMLFTTNPISDVVPGRPQMAITETRPFRIWGKFFWVIVITMPLVTSVIYVRYKMVRKICRKDIAKRWKRHENTQQLDIVFQKRKVQELEERAAAIIQQVMLDQPVPVVHEQEQMEENLDDVPEADVTPLTLDEMEHLKHHNKKWIARLLELRPDLQPKLDRLNKMEKLAEKQEPGPWKRSHKKMKSSRRRNVVVLDRAKLDDTQAGSSDQTQQNS